MSYFAKLYHWSEPNPWAGCAFPNPDPVPIDNVTLRDGHVASLRSPLWGRPCFGIPTAWLRHGHTAQVYVRGRYMPSRCQACNARPGCERVAESRLGETEALRIAVTTFRSLGGAAELNKTDGGRAQRAFGKVIEELVEVGSKQNCNDPRALDRTREALVSLRAKERIKKREQRERNDRKYLSEGHIPDVLVSRLESERIYRILRYRNYKSSNEAPRRVKQGDANFTADVWYTRTLLRLQGQSTAPYTIAKHMIESGRAPSSGHESLRDRIISTLARIDLLETKIMPGSSDPVWARFDAKRTLRDIQECPLRSLAPEFSNDPYESP